MKEENWHKIATGLVIYSCKHIMIPKTFCELGGKNKPATCILQRGQNCFNKKCLQSLLKENLRLKGIGSGGNSEWEIMSLSISKRSDSGSKKMSK